MEKNNIYQDISARTGGEIYFGVVGPVRSGKTTFNKIAARWPVKGKRYIARTYTKLEKTCMIDTDLLQSLLHFSFSGFLAVRRQVRRPWERIIQKSTILVIQMLRDLGEKIFKIIIRFQSVGFRCFCNAIDYGAGLCPCDRIDHHPVLLTDAESPDRLLGGIIVHGNFSVIEEHFQVSFLVDGVLEAFPGLALLRHLREIFFYPREIDLHQWADAPLAAVPALFCREPLQLLFLPTDGLIIVSARYARLSFCFAFGRALTASSYRRLACALFENWNKAHARRRIFHGCRPKGKAG